MYEKEGNQVLATICDIVNKTDIKDECKELFALNVYFDIEDFFEHCKILSISNERKSEHSNNCFCDVSILILNHVDINCFAFKRFMLSNVTYKNGTLTKSYYLYKK